ncbi:hypothetical protein [Streptomyces sp. JJ36]|uniref:hypothetical protein n=1 Tax=Streptomyces sp. JJ36 TaxID=2736645 RepID=UPI001F1CE99E|nr:hypothetical protein [Streptomyces sp. JJ36]MCF6524150.1 hypothetical protein [Streptomyces sp. JJ36]
MSFGQGGPAWGPGGSSTPDWAALAEQAERKRARRRRWLLAGGGALATAAVAGIVAVAVISEGGGSSPSAKPSESLPPPGDLPSEPTGPQPSFATERPPAPPEDYLKDPAKDTAPLGEDTLFPDEKVTVRGRQYQRAETDTAKKCADAAQQDLVPVLRKHGCEKLFRATYERDGLAFTLGIAVFGSEAAAAEVKSGYEPNVAALPGGGVPDFCRVVLCRTTVNALGRYAFFTIAGHTDGTPAGDDDEKAKQAALDGSYFGHDRLMERGKRQSEADAAAG